jgi:uncharacterized protein YgbK (DUF1537 family)
MTQQQIDKTKEEIINHAEAMIDYAIDNNDLDREGAIDSIADFFESNESHVSDCFVDTLRKSREIAGENEDSVDEIKDMLESGIIDYINNLYNEAC